MTALATSSLTSTELTVLSERLCRVDQINALLIAVKNLMERVAREATDRIAAARASSFWRGASELQVALLRDPVTDAVRLRAAQLALLAREAREQAVILAETPELVEASLALETLLATIGAGPTCRRKTAAKVLWIALPLAALGVGLILWKWKPRGNRSD